MNRRLRLLLFTCMAMAFFSVTAGIVDNVAAGNAQVSQGPLQTYATGLERGYVIEGHAQLVRNAAGRTLALVQASGLAPNTTYPVHVHNAPCAVNNGGGHYQHEVGGPVDAINEIWPGLTTNAAGYGAGKAFNDFSARPEAQAIVIHDTDGARIACADLQ